MKAHKSKPFVSDFQFCVKRAIGFSSFVPNDLNYFKLLFFLAKSERVSSFIEFWSHFLVFRPYWGLFLESPDSKLLNFMSAVFAFKIKVPIVLKMI